MNRVHIRAGTTDKSSDSYFSVEPNSEGEREFRIRVSSDAVMLSGNYKSSAAGGGYGSYGVKRVGLFSVPIAVAIELCTRGLLEGDHKLSDGEIKKLLLAISASIPTEKG